MTTKAESVSDIVYFKLKYITMLMVTKANAILLAWKELAKAIENNLPSQIPATNYEDLKKLSKMFDDMASVKIPEDKWGASSCECFGSEMMTCFQG